MNPGERKVGFFSLSAYFFWVTLASGWTAAAVALFWTPAPALRPAVRIPFGLGMAVFSLLVAAFWSYRLQKKLGRAFLLFQLGILAAVAVGTGTLETWARFRLTPWPGRLLHGTSVSAAADRVRAVQPRASGPNSWGQRDRERNLAPAPGITRVALLGGSFLEEASLTPLSRTLEEKVGAPYEFVNLGVRGSSPRETFWRAKNVALPLGADRWLLFFDPTEDFLWPMASETQLLPHLARLVIDRPPRGSLMGDLFPGLTQRLFPLSTPENSALERDITSRLRKGKPEDLTAVLAKLVPASRLSGLDLRPLTRALARPDLGLIHPPFLRRMMTETLVTGTETVAVESLELTARWLLATARLARRSGAQLSVVLIPPAETVDDRLRDLWSPVGDIRRGATKWTKATDWLKAELENRVDTIDLQPSLVGTRGTYLNGDGRWSRSGNEVAASRIAERFAKASPTSGLP